MNRAAVPLLALLLTATGIALVWLALGTEPAVSVPPSPVVVEMTVVSTVVVTATRTPRTRITPMPSPTRAPFWTPTPSPAPTSVFSGLPCCEGDG